MNDVPTILLEIDAGDLTAIDQLLPLVYDELPKMAAQKMANEYAGHSLQATALVHAGLSNAKAAYSMGLSPRSAQYRWAFARAWLKQKINGDR